MKSAPAEHILGIGTESDVFGLVSELARSRKLSVLVKRLNAAVLEGTQDQRDLAIAALTRMGMWQD